MSNENQYSNYLRRIKVPYLENYYTSGQTNELLEQKQDALIPGYGIEIDSSNTISCTVTGGTSILMSSVTYNELVTMRNNSNLTSGMLYRITDYVTRVSDGIENITSAEYGFDIIVRADSSYKLNENAYAYDSNRSEGYFNNSKLNAWRLKYTLDNNDSRFNWGNTVNGKGIIYYLMDEFGNSAPYDFKNIMQRDGEYTFGFHEEDYSLYGYTNKVFNNTILPYINETTNKQEINLIRLPEKGCYGNTIKTSCVDSYINFEVCESDISMNNIGKLVVFKTQSFITGIDNLPIPKGLHKEYLTFESTGTGTTTIQLSLTYDVPSSFVDYPPAITIEVSKDKNIWSSVTCSYDTQVVTLASLSEGEKL